MGSAVARNSVARVRVSAGDEPDPQQRAGMTPKLGVASAPVTEVTEPRRLLANEIALVMGSSRIDPNRPLPQDPTTARIPGGFLAAGHELEEALAPDSEGARSLVNINFKRQERVVLEGEVKVIPVVNDFARAVGIYADSLDDQNAAFHPKEVSKIITLDNPVVRALIENGLWRIALWLARPQVVSKGESVKNPCEAGMSLLLRAVHDSDFRDKVLESQQIAMESINDGGYSYTCDGDTITAKEYAKLWRPTLPDYKLITAGTNKFWYQQNDGFCWAHLADESPDRVIVAHEGDVRILGDLSYEVRNPPHGWVREATTAENPDIKQNFDRDLVRRKLLVTPIPNVGVLGNEVTTKANYYNHPPEEGTGPNMTMAPGFPAAKCLERTNALLLEGKHLRGYKGRPEMYEHLRDTVVAPYVRTLADVSANRGKFAAELPKGELSVNDLDELRTWTEKSFEPLPLDAPRVITIYAYIVQRVHDAALPIFGELSKQV